MLKNRAIVYIDTHYNSFKRAGAKNINAIKTLIQNEEKDLIREILNRVYKVLDEDNQNLIQKEFGNA